MLAQKGECRTWNQNSQVQSSPAGNILLLDFFLFSCSKGSDTNIANIVNFV